MTIDPEDVRKHLAAKQSQAGPSAALSLEAMAAPAAAVPPTKEAAILESISASYFQLRLGLAVLAFALPILLWLGAGHDHLQGSISAYYHYSAVGDLRYGAGTVRDVLVGILCAAGAALYFYKGYSWQENLALNIAGIAAILLALAPMDWPHAPLAQKSFLSLVHSGAAVVFFLGIAFVCLFRSGDTLELIEEGDRRRRFKRLYALFGTLMIVLPLTAVLLNYLMPVEAESNRLIFTIEVVAIYVFAFFWVAKSREIALLERH